MKKLIVITTFVLLGILANSAMAKDKDQIFTSPAIEGHVFRCLAINDTDDQIDIEVSLYDLNGDIQVSFLESPDAGAGTGTRSYVAAEAGSLVYCRFEWIGEARDFKLSVCAISFIDGASATCLNVY